MTSEINRCYQTLELEPGASQEQAKQAWRELVKVWHPDRFQNDAKLQIKAQERLKEINLAYEKLQKFLTSGTLPTQSDASQIGATETPRWTPPPSSGTDATTNSKPNSAARWFLVLPAACGGYLIVMLLTFLSSQEHIWGYRDASGREIQVIQVVLGKIIAAIVFVLCGTKTAPNYKIETAVSLAVLFSMAVSVLFTIGTMRGPEGFIVGWGWAGFCGLIGIVSAIATSISVYRSENEARKIAEIRKERFKSDSKISV